MMMTRRKCLRTAAFLAAVMLTAIDLTLLKKHILSK